LHALRSLLHIKGGSSRGQTCPEEHRKNNHGVCTPRRIRPLTQQKSTLRRTQSILGTRDRTRSVPFSRPRSALGVERPLRSGAWGWIRSVCRTAMGPRGAARSVRVRAAVRLHRGVSLCGGCRTSLRYILRRVSRTQSEGNVHRRRQRANESTESGRHLSRPRTDVYRTSGTSFLPFLDHFSSLDGRCSSSFGRNVQHKSTRRPSYGIARRANHADSGLRHSRVKPRRTTLSKHSRSSRSSLGVLADPSQLPTHVPSRDVPERSAGQRQDRLRRDDGRRRRTVVAGIAGGCTRGKRRDAGYQCVLSFPSWYMR
jgi:hypothetical protein